MDGFTRCQFCLRVVPVCDRLLKYHISTTWGKRCCGAGTIARWVEDNSLDAFARNMLGVCMKCGHTKTNPDCYQCCQEKRLSL